MVSQKRLEKFQNVAVNRQRGLVVVLEDIHDPHNAAAVLRTCEAFGIQSVYFIFEQERYYNPRRVGKASSSSANKWLDFKMFRSTQACLASLRRRGYEVVATALTGSAASIFKARLTSQKLALLFGNEHRGLSDEALRRADRVVSIPMRGMVQSLNLSVTAGIVIYEVTRQRQKKPEDYRLSLKEQHQLVRAFAKKK